MSATPMMIPSPASSSSAAALAGMGTGKAPGERPAELSFFSGLLAGMVDVSFFAPQPADETSDETAAPVSFGGVPFNLDPALLVIPAEMSPELTEGNGEEDAASLLQDPALLTALTAGLPAQTSATAPCCAMPVSLNGETTTTPADPRLIATGLDPAALEGLTSSLAAQATGTDEASDETPLAFISFLPEDSAASSAVKNDRKNAHGLENALAKMPEHAGGRDTLAALLAARTGNPAQQAEGTQPPADVPAESLTNAPTTTADDPAVKAHLDPFLLKLAQLTGRERNYGQAPTNLLAQAEGSAQNTNAGKPESVPAPVKSANGETVTGMLSLSKEDKTAAALPFGATLLSFLGLDATETDINSAQVLGTTPGALLAGQGQMTALTNPSLHCGSAISAHPATQVLGHLILKGARSGEAQTLAVQLDPPELGKVRVQMKYEEGEPLKVHVVVEKADTLAMLQRDSHALQHALNEAGIRTGDSSLSFDLAQGQNEFQQALNQNGSGGNSGTSALGGDAVSASAEEDILETRMSVFTDPRTGLTHYNFLV
jgi:flagellar hook-length control protein FliK